MKKIVIVLNILILCTGLRAQDTLYVHKKNATLTKIHLLKNDSLKIISGQLDYTATEIELNKQNFKKWNPIDIPYQEYSSMFGIDKIWNNKWGVAVGNGECYSTRSGGNSTSSITFDLNYLADNTSGKGWVLPTRMKIYARSSYNYSSLGKNIRVWGSTSPNVLTTNTTGPDAWVLLSPEEGFLLAPPSGQSGLTPTTLDKKYIEEDGYELFLKADVPPIRYIRLETVSKWSTSSITAFTYGEVSVWGKEKKQFDTLCIVKNIIESVKIPISNIDSVKFEGPLSSNYAYDIDLNPYHTVKIGTQTWMVENLKTTRFRNGEAIPIVTSNTAWAGLTSAGRCYYANDSINNEKYGYLYNWKAVNDSRKIAPAGWHVANDNDWSTLISYLGESDATSKLKDKGWIVEQSSNAGTNETGFTALQAGSRSNDGTFSNAGVSGNWWCSTYDVSTGKPWWISINDSKTVNKLLADYNTNGYSVRCVRNELPQISTEKISESGNNVVIGGKVTNNGGDVISECGICWGTNPNPTINDNRTINYSGGQFSSNVIAPLHLTTYYICAYATNSVGTSYGDVVSFTTPDNRVYDIDGNAYHAITIGTQTWMVEDLKTTRYRNGETIENVSDNVLWTALTTSAISINSGYFYNWYAVNDSRKIAPEGWHIPSDAEWVTLTNYLGGNTVAGGKIKMSGFQYWIKPNTGATNETGFSALANGMRDNSCIAKLLGSNAYWWSSSEFNTNNAVYRTINNTGSSILDGYFIKQSGLSVRCIKD